MRTTEKLPGGVTGKGFVAGQASPNPGGRPRGIAALVRAQTNDGQEMVDLMLKIMRGEPMPRMMKLPSGEEMTVLQTPPTETRMDAVAWLADRGFGKPTQKLEGEIRVPIGIVHRTPAHDPLARSAEQVLDVTPDRVPGVPRRQLRP